ncbi:MAG: competence/damage-inducible protein A [Lachnospiraceae bacterium]|nr:competence/damage-inducible protein A [Lachnospiraceae bacterium]
MNVELIAVGTEILMGNIVNTNSAFLAAQCAKYGLSCLYQSVVGDNAERIEEQLRIAISRSDMVIMCGGLGPTKDDMTKEVAAKVMEQELVLYEASLESIAAYFAQRKIEMTANNNKQALLPKDGIILTNNNGTAPGCIMEKNGKSVILLPGPPNELIPMWKESVVPYVEDKIHATIYSKLVKISGVSESKIATMIADLIDNQSNPTIATYAKVNEVHIRVSAKAEDESAAKKLVKPIVKELKNRFGNYVYTTDEDTTLEKSVVDLLIGNDLTVGTVESCTGGLLAGRLINVPGVSDAFKSGLITYSNKAKRKFLGVKKSTIEKYSAVSAETAEEMVRGLHGINKADVIVATTGYAGPDGGSDDKPVGLVYIGCYVCGKIQVREYRFKGNRSKVRDSAVAAALEFMRECILEYYSEKTFGSNDR